MSQIKRSTTIPIVSRIVGDSTIPATTVSTRLAAPATIFNTQSVGLRTYNIAGAYSGLTTLNAPALASNTTETVTTKVTLTTFPLTFVLSPNTTGNVIVTAALTPNNNLPVGVVISNIAAGFVYGPNSSITTTLSPGIRYTQPAIYATIGVLNLGAGAGAFSFTIVLQALLIGAVNNNAQFFA